MSRQVQERASPPTNITGPPFPVLDPSSPENGTSFEERRDRIQTDLP